MSLLALDIDNFKHVNDRYGHDVGDAVITHIGSLATEMTRNQDLVARRGGEEYAVLLPETNIADAARLAERIRAAVESTPATTRVGDISVTASMGVDRYRRQDKTLDDALRRADALLYEAKRGGRNRVGAPVDGADSGTSADAAMSPGGATGGDNVPTETMD